GSWRTHTHPAPVRYLRPRTRNRNAASRRAGRRRRAPRERANHGHCDGRHDHSRNTVRRPIVVWDADVTSVPGPHHICLHGIPFGWSRVVPFAGRRPAHRRSRPAPVTTVVT